MEPDNPPEDTLLDANSAAREDTEAILSRRRFLIQSSLVGAGLAAGGCDKSAKTGKGGGVDSGDKSPKPGICLKVSPPKPDAASQPCLSVPDMGPPPMVCLRPKRSDPDPPMRPRPRNAMVCLSKPKPKPKPRRPMPIKCLSIQILPKPDKDK